ncbi:MAG: hypothetical protein ACOH2J_02775 [Allorhizobium sp.]
MVDQDQLFFALARKNPFSGRLSAGQVGGMAAILAHWRTLAVECDRRHLAYMLATTFHETGRRMQPVRETGASSDAAAIRILDKAFAEGRLKQIRAPYWRRDVDGRSWLGRGLVQITHKRNYEKLSAATGIDLVSDPACAMEMEMAVKILFVGMEQGLFTGVRLGNVFGATTEDWVGARRIINGRDRADLVAGYGRAFFAALSA